jgi:hypothetical protein
MFMLQAIGTLSTTRLIVIKSRSPTNREHQTDSMSYTVRQAAKTC